MRVLVVHGVTEVHPGASCVPYGPCERSDDPNRIYSKIVGTEVNVPNSTTADGPSSRRLVSISRVG